jgi:hypothetical protein
MTQQEKQVFINSFMDSVKKDLLDKVNKNLVPDNWDGFELRQWISDTFSDEVKPMVGNRKKYYKNDVLVNNL